MIISNLEIKKIRKSLGLTQGDFAKTLEVSLRTVQKWESGESEVRKSTALAIRNMHNLHTEGNVSDKNLQSNSLILDESIFDDEIRMSLFVRFLMNHNERIKEDVIGSLYIKKIEDDYQTRENIKLAKKELRERSAGDNNNTEN